MGNNQPIITILLAKLNSSKSKMRFTIESTEKKILHCNQKAHMLRI